MSKKGKEAKLDSLAAQLEKNYMRNIEREYRRAYREMRAVINDYAAKYAVAGKLGRTEMYKYNRYKKLIKQLRTELAVIENINQPKLAAYLVDQYQLNYFYSGYIMETEYQARLAYGNLKRAKISRGVLTPMSKISLRQNRELVRQKIQSSVVQGIAQGEGMQELTKRIRVDLEQNANNALRIARTETTRVMNASRMDSYEHAKKMGLPIKKRWVATLDDRTRDRHQSMDGEIVDTDDEFSNGLMHPGDQGGPPEETINCRCTMVTVIEGYNNAYEYRKARGLTGKNEIIKNTNYTEWKKERVS